MWDLSSPTRGRTVPLVLKVGLLTTGQPGKHLRTFTFIKFTFFFYDWVGYIRPPCKHYSTLESYEYNSHANISKKKKNIIIFRGI